MKKLNTLIPAFCIIAGLLITGSCSMDSFGGLYGPSFGDEAGYYEPDDKVPPQEGDKFDKIIENDFIATAEEPVSTFSVDADGAYYSYLRACLRNNYIPSKDFIRIEELLNYFPFDYAGPADGENVALNAEVGVCPWQPEHKLMRLGIQGQYMKDSEIPTANFVFLIDTSGSMDGEDRLSLLKSSLISMIPTMRSTDRISIIAYSGYVKKVLASTPVSESSKIISAIKSLSAYGSTAGGAAMEMAYKEALANFIEGGNNRVIMGTDGDFNVGVTNTDALLEMVQNYAGKGIYLTICGFGVGNLNDSMMETLSNKGNGTYEYIACSDDMEKVFVRERSKFYSVANDCKIQIKFNPETVAQYRLIGYENRKMSNEDFDNDKVDAAEIGAGQSITALYELIPVPEAEAKYADFDFRYKKALGADSRLISLEILPAGEEMSESFHFASAVAAFGLIAKDSKYKGEADFNMVHNLAEIGSKSFDPYGYRKTFDETVSQYEKLYKEKR